MNKTTKSLIILTAIFAGIGGWYVGIQKEPLIEIVEVEKEVIKEVKIIKEKECKGPDLDSCTPFLEYCKFDYLYEAIKDSPDFKKGDKFHAKNLGYYPDMWFCKIFTIEEEQWYEERNIDIEEKCYHPKDIVNSEYFKSVK